MLYTSAFRVDINLTAAMRILLPSTLMTGLACLNPVLNRMLADDHAPMPPVLRIHLVLHCLCYKPVS